MKHFLLYALLLQFSSVSESCPTLCDPKDCSTPGLPVPHQLLEFTQTRVHWVSDAVQPSHPMLSPSPPAFSLIQHQGLFKWVSSLHEVAKGSEFQLQHQSFQCIFRTDFLWKGLAGSLCSPRDPQESSPTPQFKSINSALSFLCSPTLTSIHDYWKNHSFEFKNEAFILLYRADSMYNLLWKEKVCFWYIQVRSGKGLEWEKPSPLPFR